MAAYYACRTLIKIGRTAGLVDKINLFMAFDQLTADQYTELMGIMPTTEATADVADGTV